MYKKICRSLPWAWVTNCKTKSTWWCFQLVFLNFAYRPNSCLGTFTHRKKLRWARCLHADGLKYVHVHGPSGICCLMVAASVLGTSLCMCMMTIINLSFACFVQQYMTIVYMNEMLPNLSLDVNRRLNLCWHIMSGFLAFKPARNPTTLSSHITTPWRIHERQWQTQKQHEHTLKTSW